VIFGFVASLDTIGIFCSVCRFTVRGSLHRLGWTEKVTTLATELLRAGRCETFDDVMAAMYFRGSYE
jgi:hypothetical protein